MRPFASRGCCVLPPDHCEAAGALSLMLLTHARMPARANSERDRVPLADQDRDLWDRDLVAEGTELLERLPYGQVGPFQLQTSIAAVHAEARSSDETDWLQISLIYSMLEKMAPSPVVSLNKAVAEATALGPLQGLNVLAPLMRDKAMVRHHRFHAMRAHLPQRTAASAQPLNVTSFVSVTPAVRPGADWYCQ